MILPFVETEYLGKPGESGEKKVWDSIKQAYRDKERTDKCLAYWRYPLFTNVGQTRKEPDILIADKDNGIIIIEVKSITIHQLVAVNGHLWEYKDFYEHTGNPYQQAENQLFSLLGIFDREAAIRRKISGKVLIALPNISEEEWISHGFDRLPSVPPIIFNNDLGRATLLAKIENTINIQKGEEINDERWKMILSILSGSPIYRKEITEAQSDITTRLGVVNSLIEKLSEMDIQQENIGKTIPSGPQRIRGIAGSGKSVLLCQKAAHMYLKHPDWDIALVFYSRSLYEEVVSQVDKWLRHFSNGDVCYNEEVGKKLKILHSWGGKSRQGFYSYICEAHGERKLTLNDAKDQGIRGTGDSLGYICTQFLKNVPEVIPLFDAVLIDEGQDFMVSDAYKFEDKQPFYWFAYQVLRPVDKTDPTNRRLIWAYDESQSLDNLVVPTARELFGNAPEFKQFVSGIHKGGIRKSEIMHRCYRTPGPILTAAHAIGMGLLRPEGMLRGITNKDDWKNIGYEVLEGNFRQGEKIVLQRPSKNSPNLVPKVWNNPVLEFKTYISRNEELQALATEIKNNLQKDHLKASKNILVIVLGEAWEASVLQKEVAKVLMQHQIDIYIPAESGKNTTNTFWRDKKLDQFWEEGAVTISLVPRAKGNEAHMVYVVGADLVASNEGNIQLRNQLFVGLTRSKGWAKLSGISHYDMYDEINHVIKSDDTFEFTFKRAPLQNINEDLEEVVFA
ncbi:NERD domain-containing protein [Lysinibacillus sp. FSL H8-0500]|uniref:DEAD/DEAH box helicase n=1 Tax=Lysinibacillus sp. FSL H8-0500 TaxID=2921393 RepID=UPI0031014FEE